MAEDGRFDNLFLHVAQQCGGIDDLMDAFLGFLQRRTDAFSPPGGYDQLESAWITSLKRHYELAQRAKAKAAAGKKSAKPAAPAPAPAPAPSPSPAAAPPTESKPAAAGATTSAPAAPVEEEGVIELSPSGTFDLSSVPAVPVPPTAPATDAAVPAVAAEALAESAASPSLPAPVAVAGAGAGVVDGTDDSSAEAKPTGAKPLLGNGGKTDRYSWTQTLKVRVGEGGGREFAALPACCALCAPYTTLRPSRGQSHGGGRVGAQWWSQAAASFASHCSPPTPSPPFVPRRM